MNEPHDDEWRALYQAAREFRNLAPWEWMNDTDNFGVQNPEGGEIGWCCVLGAAGEVYGLGVYIGDVGFNLLRNAMEDRLDPSEGAHLMNGYLACFESRDDMDERDIAVIRSLGLRFRGQGNWPQFRSNQPSCVPWYLEAHEARFLTLLLQQATEVAKRYGAYKLDLPHWEEGTILVRVPSSKPHEDEWTDEIRQTPGRPQPEVLPPIDRVRLQRILKQGQKVHATWEIHAFHAPAVIDEGERRPFFPIASLVVDEAEGFVVHTNLLDPPLNGLLLRDSLLKAMEEVRAIPTAVRVRTEKAHRALESIAQHLDIDLKQQDGLPALEEARSALEAAMMSDEF